jgi:hypothetical protein
MDEVYRKISAFMVCAYNIVDSVNYNSKMGLVLTGTRRSA